MRGHQDGHTPVRKAIDHFPEGATGQRVHSRGGLIKKKHARLVHDCRAKSDALLPTARQAAGHQMAPALQPGKRKHPTLFFSAFCKRHFVNAGKELEILIDGQVVIQRKLLRHVANPLTHEFGSQRSRLSGQLCLAVTGFEQPAQNFDGGRLAGAVGPEQTINLSILNFEIQVLDGFEITERL
jgi:hypothetical protein